MWEFIYMSHFDTALTWTGEEFIVEEFVGQVAFFWAEHGDLGLKVTAGSIAALKWKKKMFRDKFTRSKGLKMILTN